MPNGIWDKDTYITADAETRDKMTFDMIKAIFDKQCTQIEKNEPRFKALENRKWKDKGFAGAAGLVGGFLAGYLKRII